MNRLLSSFIVAGLSIATATAQPYVVTTLAGSPTVQPGTDGTGSSAGFNYSGSLTLDSQRNVYVADSGAIRRVTPSGDVTTLAGVVGVYGYQNGHGANARFSNDVAGLAVDSAGTVYVAERGTHAIRKVGANGEVSHFAGAVGSAGFVDGPGGTARFAAVMDLAVDRSGSVYVADSGNRAIRRITPSGVVTTFVGPIPGNPNATYFYAPHRISLDLSGNVYVTDLTPRYGTYLMKVDASGTTVTNILSSPLPFTPYPYFDDEVYSEWDVRIDPHGNRYAWEYLTGRFLRLSEDGRHTVLYSGAWSGNWVVDGRGSIYSFAGRILTKAQADVPAPTIVTQPTSLTLVPGGTAVFAVEVSGGTAVTYQWKRNGVAIPGAQAPIAVLESPQEGSYSCVVTHAGGNLESAAAQLTIVSSGNPGHLSNMSVRTWLDWDVNLIVGLTLAGGLPGSTTPVLFRAVGPSLAAFGLTDFLPNPWIKLQSLGVIPPYNDQWGGDPTIAAVSNQVGAFPLAGILSLDAALYRPALAAGPHWLSVSDLDGGAGIVLAEVYDASPAGVPPGSRPRISNISARCHVGRGSDVLFAGFVIGGQTARTLVIRAIGPSLSAFAVNDALPDPRLQLFAGTQLIGENDQWGDAGSQSLLERAFTRVGAFALPAGSRDAALVTTLPPGSYTVQVSGAGNGMGTALIELYDLP